MIQYILDGVVLLITRCGHLGELQPPSSQCPYCYMLAPWTAPWTPGPEAEWPAFYGLWVKGISDVIKKTVSGFPGEKRKSYKNLKIFYKGHTGRMEECRQAYSLSSFCLSSPSIRNGLHFVTFRPALVCFGHSFSPGSGVAASGSHLWLLRPSQLLLSYVIRCFYRTTWRPFTSFISICNYTISNVIIGLKFPFSRLCAPELVTVLAYFCVHSLSIMLGT